MIALRAAALIATGLAIAVPSGLDSCSIAPPEPVFATSQRPADTGQFLKGKVGILQRSYRQTYLIGAFRILSSVPLTEAEIQSLYGPPAGSPGGRTAARGSAARDGPAGPAWRYSLRRVAGR